MPARLYLCRHIFFREISGAIVFLDLRKERYFALAATEAALLSTALVGLSKVTLSQGLVAESRRSSTLLIQNLLQSGVLTTCAEVGKPAEPLAVASRESMVFRALSQPTTQIRAQHIWKLITSILITFALLRCSGVRGALSHSRCGMDAGSDPTEITLSIVSTFLRLRPWFYRAAGACLFDSLVLRRYLMSFGVSADLVVGVQLKPFAAHAWAQIGDVVLNDTAEAVLDYSPLLRA